jgi:outer membrane receptor protein involved in Fe transport
MSDATTYVHYWAANYCHDATYYSQADYPYYFANPDTGNIVWWGTYCSGETVEGDYLSVYYEPVNEDKLTAEIRLQGGGDTFEWIVGAYYEESNDDWLDPFHAPTPGGRIRDQFAASNYANSISRAFNEFYFGGDWSNTTSNWSAGQKTSWEQKAIFGEMTWHINDKWDLTAGGRYFDRSSKLEYWSNSPGRQFHNEGRYTSDEEYREAHDGVPPLQVGEDTQFIPKLAVSYKPSDDTMIYALYTEGVRQGGANRGRGDPFFPKSFESDLMKNHEVGFRSSFADGRGRLNMTLYHMAWEDYQLQALDPSFSLCIDPETGEEVGAIVLKIPGVCGQPWQTVIANLGEAHITGGNVTVDYTPNDTWVLGFNFELMEAETDSDHDILDVHIESGWKLPLTPDYKGAAWAEYRQPTSLLGAHDYFVRLQWSFTGDSVSRLEPLSEDWPTPQFVNPAYNIGDLRVGLVGDDWQVDMYVNNLTDERAIYQFSSGPPIIWQAAQIAEGRLHHQSAFVARPREFGVRYTKRWGG